MSKLGIVILNWNGYKDSIECIESLVKFEKNKYTIFLLDNGSDNDSVDILENWIEKKYPYKYIFTTEDEFICLSEFREIDLVFIKGEKNLGFAKGNNLILDNIKHNFEYYFLLNNDTVVTDGAVNNMVNYMDENLDTGVSSCNIKLYSNPNVLWNAGGRFTWYGDRKYYTHQKIKKDIEDKKISIKSPFVTGCALLIRRDVLLEYGLFTEKFFFGEEDFNYCKRLENNGVLIESILTSIIYHKVSSSINTANVDRKQYYSKYILHFSNRIIDQKEFYGKKYWEIWRLFYLKAIFLKVLMFTKNINITKKTIKKISYYTNEYDSIDYNLFKEINEFQPK